jgi:hypothetical protein
MDPLALLRLYDALDRIEVLERRERNLSAAFAAVSFLFAVHLLIDLFRCF